MKAQNFKNSCRLSRRTRYPLTSREKSGLLKRMPREEKSRRLVVLCGSRFRGRGSARALELALNLRYRSSGGRRRRADAGNVNSRLPTNPQKPYNLQILQSSIPAAYRPITFVDRTLQRKAAPSTLRGSSAAWSFRPARFSAPKTPDR